MNAAFSLLTTHFTLYKFCSRSAAVWENSRTQRHRDEAPGDVSRVLERLGFRDATATHFVNFETLRLLILLIKLKNSPTKKWFHEGRSSIWQYLGPRAALAMSYILIRATLSPLEGFRHVWMWNGLHECSLPIILTWKLYLRLFQYPKSVCAEILSNTMFSPNLTFCPSPQLSHAIYFEHIAVSADLE